MTTETLDGAVEATKYEKATPRILWLLREPNDPTGEITDLRIGLREFATAGRIHPAWAHTFTPVARTSYGLMHPAEAWEQWAHDQHRYAPTLSAIAVVNIKKTGGGAVAEWDKLVQAFGDGKRLREQVAALRPEIVIGANNLYICREWIDPTWDPKFPVDETKPYEARRDPNGTVWVHANHPSKPKDDETYFVRIRDAIAAV
jgi:hypothetical protein